jgi:flagellar M-ring protein FliF
MPGNRPGFVDQLLEMWSHLQWRQRLTVISFALLGLILIGSVVYFMNRVDYEPLYRDLNAEDAQAIAAKLKEQKKDYIVQGTSILVAASKTEVDKLRLEIAGSGLARSGRIGYEIFDKNQFGMTDFTEQVNLQRALEGELARTISSLSEIAEARVHIVLPKDSIFEDKKEDAKASVVVRLRKGSELSKAGIAGIKGVVAGAVPGLRTHNVSVVDDEGRLLSQSVESGDTARAEMENGIREQLEKEMSDKVISILEPVVGRGKVHANSSIELDFNTTEQTEETFNPNPPVVMSQQKSQERAAGSYSTPSGIPGTQSNIGSSTPQTAVPNSEHIRQSETTNYEVNKLVRHTVQPKGTIRRLSVAVILDHRTVYRQAKDGKVSSSAEPRSPKDLGAYRELVLAAVGFNQERGDVVTIENVPFFSETRPEEPPPAVSPLVKYHVFLTPAIKYGALILLFLIAYFVLFRPIRNRVLQAISVAGSDAESTIQGRLASENPPQALPAASQSDELTAPAGLPSAALGPAAAPGLPEQTDSFSSIDGEIERELMKEASLAELGTRKHAVIKKKLVEKATTEPELISQLLRSLLHEKA